MTEGESVQSKTEVDEGSVETVGILGNLQWWQWVLIINGIVGLVLFEYAYHKTRRFRNPNKDLDELYPAYRRRDALNWSKLRFYPGAIFLFIPRFVATLILLILGVIIMNILMIGYQRGTPITGCRNHCLRFWFQFGVRLIGYVSFFLHNTHEYITPEKVNYYEEYLGTAQEQLNEQINPKVAHDPTVPNHKQRVPKRGKGRPSVIVCNHLGVLDIIAMICSPFFPGFTPNEKVEKIPFVGTLALSLGSLFVERGGS